MTTGEQSKRPPKGQAKAAAAARREATRKAERRRRLLTITGSVVGILAIVGALVAIKLTQGGSSSSSGSGISGPAPKSVVQAVTGVTVQGAGEAGISAVKNGPKPITGSALTKDGKPEVLYIGAEYCPYCASERWPLVMALSRFGTFSGLEQTQSSATDVFPNTATFSFVQATYTSDYLSFTAVETADRQGKPLQKLSKDQQDVLTKYSQNGGIPFIDLGGKWVSNGASYDPSVLKGLTMDQIAGQIASHQGDVFAGIAGTSNIFTADLCRLTADKPADVCKTDVIQNLEKSLAQAEQVSGAQK